jgi:hypothetical protein
MRLSPSLRKSLKAVQADISNIRYAIAALFAPRSDIQELTGSIRDANKTSYLQETENREQLIALRTKEQVRKTSERYNRRYQNKNYGVQKWLAFGTWAAVIAAATYAGFAYQQWKEMWGTTDAAYRSADQARRTTAIAAENAQTAVAVLNENKREFDKNFSELSRQTSAQIEAAKAAKDAAKLAADSFALSQRPWIGVDGYVAPEPPRPGLISSFANGNIVYYGHFMIKNFGTAPAKAIAIGVGIAVAVGETKEQSDSACDNALNWINKGIPTAQGSVDNTKGGLVLFPGGQHDSAFVVGRGYSGPNVGDAILMGCIVYKDVGDKPHSTRFCQLISPQGIAEGTTCDYETFAD